jgi:4-amino-4-deoxy-L-arabinose transferase-like glycosyltransferase
VDAVQPAAASGWARAQRLTDRTAAAVVWVFGAVLFLPYLGSVGLWDPWETHYAEVAREMLVRGDWVYPHWESAYFFSKPALPMWMMALGLWVTGAEATDPLGPLGPGMTWGVRLPFALVAMAALWGVYRTGRVLGGPRLGVLAAVVLGTCPQFLFIGKQAMTDIPLVGFMTLGVAFLVESLFGDPEENDAPASRGWKIGAAGAVGVAGIGQVAIILTEVRGVLALAMGAGAVAFAAVAAAVAWKGRVRDCRAVLFYVFMGLAALSKSPLAVLAVVAVTIVLFLVVSFDPSPLRRPEVWWGAVLFLAISTPWYLTLSLFDGRDDEGLTFVRRFWFHDNFNRVGTGVHGDRGGLGYYYEQLAYGMFPWFALIPPALMHAVDPDRHGPRVRRALLFLVVWAGWCYVFFSASLTKFHHYIFPAVPPLAILIAVWFAWVAEAPGERLRGAVRLLVGFLFAAAAIDLINDPQHLSRLYTYKYDRIWPKELVAQEAIIGLVTTVSVALLAFQLWKKPGLQLVSFASFAVVFTLWCSHVHFNMLSQHWSQYHVFETYYDEREGDEPLYAYQLNWRGETFYSRNRVVQIMGKGANRRMRDAVRQPGREFIITEQRRYDNLKKLLPAKYREKMRIVDASNINFYLVVVED